MSISASKPYCKLCHAFSPAPSMCSEQLSARGAFAMPDAMYDSGQGCLAQTMATWRSR